MKRIIFTNHTLSAIMVLVLAMTGCSVLNPVEATPQPTDTPIPPRTLTEARVIPVRNAALSFPIAGIVDEVLIVEGELVEAGAVIARLNGVDRARAVVTQAELLVLSSQKDLDDFKEKSSISTADAELALAKARIELKNAQDARKSLDYQQVSNAALDGLRATYFLALDDFKEAEDEFEPYIDRGEKDVERANYLTKLANARLAKDRALYNLNKALEMPEPEKVARADARLSLAEAALADAVSTFDKVQHGPDPTQLVILEAAMRNAETQLEAAQASLKDLELIAPFAGTIVSNDLKPGQAVNSSVSVMLGDLTEWQVETTDLVEMDIVNVKSGDPVTVTFDAIPSLMMTGEVTRIKQLGLATKGDTTYTVTIDLENNDPRLLWNMKAFVAFGNQ